MPDSIHDYDWAGARSLTGSAEYVPASISALLTSATVEEAVKAYWSLDNHIVVQGQLFEAALPVARVLAGAICHRRDISTVGLGHALDLLVEIACGDADASEIELGNTGIGDLCRAELRRFLPCFREYVATYDERIQLAALDLLDKLGTQKERRDIAVMISTLSPSSQKVLKRFQEFVARHGLTD